MTNTGNELTGLFEVQPAQRHGFPAFAISTALHGIGIAMIAWALLHNPVIVQDRVSRNYKVRHLQLQVPETAASRAAEARYPNRNKAAQTGSGTQQASHPRSIPALTDGGRGKQILVQPELQAHVELAAPIPTPNVLVWTPALKPAETITPPAPQPLTSVDVQTSLNVPNEELRLADLPQVASDRTPVIETPPAGNSTPIAVQGPSDVKMPPATASAPTAQPTPAAVLSVSDVRMNEGTVALPPVSETSGNRVNDGAASAPQTSGNAIGVASEAQAAGETAEHIELPKDGRFGVVVVGTSLSDQYPETLDVWSDRVAYTAYLHVGTPKAWILQYAQLREADASGSGAVAHLDAPWPYDILRPNQLSKDLNADALMVHGVLNESGKLVNLAVAYPAGYVHGSYVLHELQQWQFRPAQQRGKPTAVEVLLIIPEEND